jgi:PTS system fructose-specific IIC component
MPCELIQVAASVSLAHYTRPELIIPQLRGSDPAEIFEELSNQLRAHGAISDVLSFYNAALNHEFLSSSATPYGIAVPHARSPQVQRLTFAFGRVAEPMVWGIKGSWLVDCVFLIAVPPTDASEYLSLRSGIANAGRRPGLLADLRAAPDVGRILEILRTIKVRSC